MIIDPCYSGKAFYGMTQVIEANRKSFEGHKVLFWNTGGIFNLLSQKDNFKY
jgi:1-aminocyclopropane-1-carboxylate deaminase/D-cysteine desulfhydrase-like pyridoxal-dependent ACC family enzyme